MRPLVQTIWRQIWKDTVEKNWTSVQLFFFSSMLFENTFENTYWQKIKQLQPMWLQLISRRGFIKQIEFEKKEHKQK